MWIMSLTQSEACWSRSIVPINFDIGAESCELAALCHDIGHLPFSHAAEKELLPQKWDHERLTRELVSSDEMKAIWTSITPHFRYEDVVKLAVGPKNAPDLGFSDWEAILSEIIV